MKPRVTIGVCVRNCEKMIGDAMQSISDQDFSHSLLEVIFVDDGSEDQTLSIIRSFISHLDMKVRVFHHEWKGLGISRNVIVENAEGDYIVWVDGDMILSKDYIRTLFDFMERNPKVGVCKGTYDIGIETGLVARLEIYSRAISKMANFNYITRTHSKSMGTGGSICRVKAIRNVKGFDSRLRGYGEDLDAECRIRMAGWLLYIINGPKFADYERRGLTWKELWQRYLKRGSDSREFQRQNSQMLQFFKMFPLAAFLAGIPQSAIMYRLTLKKTAFLMPIHGMFKMTAWCKGFINVSH